MDFGKLSNIQQVDFSLPADAKGTYEVLKSAPADEPVKLYVGCPIWANKDWVGKLYPSHAKSADYLKYYAQQFNTIELNTTHYRIPDAATIQKWKGMVRPGFTFAPKFPQPISHERKLQNAKDLTLAFCEAIRGLGVHLGTSFIQLPPYFDGNGLNAIAQYLESFPKDIPLAFEFRHHDWFKEGAFEEVANLLEAYQISTIITDVAGRRDVLHMRLTTPSALIRFVGNDLHATDYQRIDDWVVRIKGWLAQGLKTLYFFVHEPDNTQAPELAAYFVLKMNQVAGTQLQVPQIKDFGTQGKLF